MISWVQNDTAPVNIKLGADLTGATSVTLHVHPTPDRATTLATVTVTVDDAEAGTGHFTPIGSVQPGDYYADARIVSPTGTRTTTLDTLVVEPHA